LRRKGLFRRSLAIPSEHGSWAFLLMPLLVGLCAGERWHSASTYLVIATLAAFLGRHPLTIAVKAWSGRRDRGDLAPALAWTAFYAGVGLLHLLGLVLRGFGYVLLLALPGIPVLAWYLYLISRRAERRQLTVEILAAGVLALAAPAAFWVGRGAAESQGWLLFALTWAQSSASIAHVFLRLAQNRLTEPLELAARLRRGLPAVCFSLLIVVVVALLTVADAAPRWLFVPHALQAAETLQATLRPARQAKPTAIGLRQLVVTVLFTLLFTTAWRS
jgi:hypothetical protein